MSIVTSFNNGRYHIFPCGCSVNDKQLENIINERMCKLHKKKHPVTVTEYLTTQLFIEFLQKQDFTNNSTIQTSDRSFALVKFHIYNHEYREAIREFQMMREDYPSCEQVKNFSIFKTNNAIKISSKKGKEKCESESLLDTDQVKNPNPMNQPSLTAEEAWRVLKNSFDELVSEEEKKKDKADYFLNSLEVFLQRAGKPSFDNSFSCFGCWYDQTLFILSQLKLSISSPETTPLWFKQMMSYVVKSSKDVFESLPSWFKKKYKWNEKSNNQFILGVAVLVPCLENLNVLVSISHKDSELKKIESAFFLLLNAWHKYSKEWSKLCGEDWNIIKAIFIEQIKIICERIEKSRKKEITLPEISKSCDRYLSFLGLDVKEELDCRQYFRIHNLRNFFITYGLENHFDLPLFFRKDYDEQNFFLCKIIKEIEKDCSSFKDFDSIGLTSIEINNKKIVYKNATALFFKSILDEFPQAGILFHFFQEYLAAHGRVQKLFTSIEKKHKLLHFFCIYLSPCKPNQPNPALPLFPEMIEDLISGLISLSTDVKKETIEYLLKILLGVIEQQTEHSNHISLINSFYVLGKDTSKILFLLLKYKLFLSKEETASQWEGKIIQDEITKLERLLIPFLDNIISLVKLRGQDSVMIQTLETSLLLIVKSWELIINDEKCLWFFKAINKSTLFTKAKDGKIDLGKMITEYMGSFQKDVHEAQAILDEDKEQKKKLADQDRLLCKLGLDTSVSGLFEKWPMIRQLRETIIRLLKNYEVTGYKILKQASYIPVLNLYIQDIKAELDRLLNPEKEIENDIKLNPIDGVERKLTKLFLVSSVIDEIIQTAKKEASIWKGEIQKARQEELRLAKAYLHQKEANEGEINKINFYIKSLEKPSEHICENEEPFNFLMLNEEHYLMLIGSLLSQYTKIKFHLYKKIKRIEDDVMDVTMLSIDDFLKLCVGKTENCELYIQLKKQFIENTIEREKELSNFRYWFTNKPLITADGISKSSLLKTASLFGAICATRAKKLCIQKPLDLTNPSKASLNPVYPIRDISGRIDFCHFKTQFIENGRKTVLHGADMEKLIWDLSNILEIDDYFAPTAITNFEIQHDDSMRTLRGGVQLSHLGKGMDVYLRSENDKLQTQFSTIESVLQPMLISIIFGMWDAHEKNIIINDEFSLKFFDDIRNLPNSNKLLTFGQDLISPYRCALLGFKGCYEEIKSDHANAIQMFLDKVNTKLTQIEKYLFSRQKKLESLPSGWFVKPIVPSIMALLKERVKAVQKVHEAIKRGEKTNIRDIVFSAFPFLKFISIMTLFSKDPHDLNNLLIKRFIGSHSPNFIEIQQILLRFVGNTPIDKLIKNAAEMGVDPYYIYKRCEMIKITFENLLKEIFELGCSALENPKSEQDNKEAMTISKTLIDILQKNSTIDLKEFKCDIVDSLLLINIQRLCEVHEITFIKRFVSHTELKEKVKHLCIDRANLLLCKNTADSRLYLHWCVRIQNSPKCFSSELDYITQPGKVGLIKDDQFYTIEELKKLIMDGKDYLLDVCRINNIMTLKNPTPDQLQEILKTNKGNGNFLIYIQNGKLILCLSVQGQDPLTYELDYITKPGKVGFCSLGLYYSIAELKKIERSGIEDFKKSLLPLMKK